MSIKPSPYRGSLAEHLYGGRSSPCDSYSVDLSYARRLASCLMDLQQAFGAAVRTARLRNGWSQEKLAAVAGLDRTYVSGLERGVRNPALTTQERIADALGVPLRDLLPGGGH
jgi:ribosome-binding protein aMBF1 (putative translation factor)